MSSAFDKLKGLLPNYVHLTCNAHILNLVEKTCRKNFSTVDHLVASFKAIFVNSSSRKARYKAFIADKINMDSEHVPLPPVSAVTR